MADMCDVVSCGLSHVQIVVVTARSVGKPRGYAFIEYEHERDMHCKHSTAPCRWQPPQVFTFTPSYLSCLPLCPLCSLTVPPSYIISGSLSPCHASLDVSSWVGPFVILYLDFYGRHFASFVLQSLPSPLLLTGLSYLMFSDMISIVLVHCCCHSDEATTYHCVLKHEFFCMYVPFCLRVCSIWL